MLEARLFVGTLNIINPKKKLVTQLQSS